MKHKRSLFPIVTLIVGIILGLILMLLLDVKLGQMSPDETGKKVKDLYELSTGANIEIINVLKESGMYKVIFRATDVNGDSSILEVFVTQDGKILSQNPMKIDEFISNLNKQKAFIDCLSDKGLKIYGISNNTATQLQLVQVLGGSRFLSKIYVDCVDSNLQVCLDAGVTTVPSIIYQKEVYEGVKILGWFENTTNCVYER